MPNNNLAQTKPVIHCPYCQGTRIIKKGLRRKKLETIQLYYCPNCRKKFTPLISKGKTYPLPIILEAITAYNRFLTLEQACRRVGQSYGLKISPQNLSNWLKSFRQYISFLRMRDFIAQKYKPSQVFAETRLFHEQIYDFRYHRAKAELLLNEEFRHSKFRPLKEFLEIVSAECPHQVFRQSQTRASELKNIFNFDQVKITSRPNLAVAIAKLVLQAVANLKLRHQILQEFMFINDSVTVACEVPVLLDEEDILHYQNQLGFEIYERKWEMGDGKLDNEVGNGRRNISLQNVSLPNPTSHFSPLTSLPKLITGHIDLLQIRNGAIHILDYKPSASKEKPLDQLTLYALALSRLTGIRLFNFKCAWFDEEDYFEFYPLHVVYKKKKRKQKKPQRY